MEGWLLCSMLRLGGTLLVACCSDGLTAVRHIADTRQGPDKSVPQILVREQSRIVLYGLNRAGLFASVADDTCRRCRALNLYKIFSFAACSIYILGEYIPQQFHMKPRFL